MENAVYAYITLATLAQIGEQPYFDRLDILVAQNPLDEAFIRRVAADAGQRIAAAGHAVARVDVPTPGKHPHAAVMGLLLLAMAVFGLFVLALSGILVVNLMTALMASEVRQIGVMKAIGATPGQVARIYLSEAGVLGAAALVIALAAGNLGSRLLCRYLSVFLNFDIGSFAVPAWVNLLAALVGLALPLLASAYPVVKSSRITVAAALADFGVQAGEFGETRMDRLLSRLSGPTRPVLFAMRNAFRRRTRLALTVATLAVAGLFFSTAWNVRASLIHTLDRLFASRKFDLTVSLGGMFSVEKVERACRKTPGVLAQEGWVATEGSVLAQASTGKPVAAHAPGGQDTGGTHAGEGGNGGGALGPDRFSVLALPESTRMVTPDIVSGRGLGPGDVDAIVVNTALAAREPQMKVGREISIAMGPGTTSWRVVGITREPFSPPAAYVTRALFDRHGHAGMVNTLRLSLTKPDDASIQAIRAQIETNLAAEGVTVLGSASKGESRFGFDQHMVMIYVLLVVASAVIGGVGGLGLATTMSLAVLERRREIGILRAVGARPAAVMWLVLAESAAIGIASWMLAAAAAWPVGKVTADFLVAGLFRDRLDFSLEAASLLIWLAVSLSIAASASILPAWTASRKPVREALEYE
jgi:putative ABC transport system permease protein